MIYVKRKCNNNNKEREEENKKLMVTFDGGPDDHKYVAHVIRYFKEGNNNILPRNNAAIRPTGSGKDLL